MVAEPKGDQGHYEQLRQRAIIFVREQGGAALEETVISHVFGGGGNAALWRPLLRQVMTGDDRVMLRSDGYWAVPEATGAPNHELPRDYVVLDVETTGLKPYRQRIIEVGVIRYSDGVRHDVFSTLVNPERKLPAYISQLTGIDERSLASAPPFRLVVDQILRFIEENLIVGYNVEFDVSFLNAELKRLSRPPLLNERLDLLPLASSLLPGVRKPGLDGLCRSLDIVQRERHRALADAEATSMAFSRMLELAPSQGLRTLESLQRAAAVQVPVPQRRGSVGRGRAVLDRSHLDSIPRTPGVYLMRDVHDRVIYVGKAKNLRNRVSSYYSQPLGYTRKMDGLLESIARIEVVEAGSELQALILESQFIRRYQPQYNTQQRRNESYPYIKIDIGSQWPTVTLTRQRAVDDAVYFGPFRVASAARAAVDLVHDVFPLRSCSRSFRNARSYGSPCLELSLGRCPGPCVGSADRDRYRETVHEVIAFLRGEREDAISRIHQQLEDAAQRLDFERAARLRDRVRRVQQLVMSQQLLDQTVERGNVLIVTPSPEPGAREVLFIVGGRLWAQLCVASQDPDEVLAHRLDESWKRAMISQHQFIDHNSCDEVNIVGRWLRKYAGHPAILRIDAESPDWLTMASAVRSMSREALAFDQVGAVTGEVPDPELDVADVDVRHVAATDNAC